MVGQLGTDWESKYSEFQTKPFAAASIGQVHFASLHDGTKVLIFYVKSDILLGLKWFIDIAQCKSVM